MRVCSVEGCGKKVDAKGLCPKHYAQFRRHGKVLERSHKDLNIIHVFEKTCEVELYDMNYNVIGRVIIDVEDYEKIKHLHWGKLTKIRRGKDNSYAFTRIKDKNIQMHRFLLNLTDPKIQVDHINHNPLDNRRSNIRIATNQQNNCNKRKSNLKKSSSEYKGVSKNGNCWIAAIMINYKRIHIGCYKTETQAAFAYNAAAQKYFGEFAYLNDIKIKRRFGGNSVCRRNEIPNRSENRL